MKKQIIAGMATVILILVLTGSICGVVFGKPQHSVERNREDYQQMEEVYVDQVRGILAREGLTSAGVMLTYETGRDGGRHYTLAVNHHRLENFGQDRIDRLENNMENCFFSSEECSMSAEFNWM